MAAFYDVSCLTQIYQTEMDNGLITLGLSEECLDLFCPSFVT
jgi:hypothetical protein